MSLNKDLGSGAFPTATFPNAHLAGPRTRTVSGESSSQWAAPEASTHLPLQQLQEAVVAEDWAGNYAEGKTKFQAQAAWSAGAERCSTLQCLATMNGASKCLEVGSFCGAAALALAEAIPKDGQVVALELEPYFVEFGQKFRSRSQAGSKINIIVGDALESLTELVRQASQAGFKPFDMVVIDSDKAHMKEYFDLILGTSGFLTPQAVVVVDTTPFKGQVPTRYVRFGQADKFEVSSGEEEITDLRRQLSDTSAFMTHEFGGILVVQRADPSRK